MVSSIGADRVIDYTREDFARSAQRYDVMIDMVGNRSLRACLEVLTTRGTYVLVGVRDLGRWFGLGRQLRMLALSPFVRQTMRVFMLKHDQENLRSLKDMVEDAKVAPVVARRYDGCARSPRHSDTRNKAAPRARSSWRSDEVSRTYVGAGATREQGPGLASCNAMPGRL